MMPMNRGIYVIAMAGIAALLLSSMGGRSAYAATIVPSIITGDAAVALNAPYSLGEQGELYICVSVERTITNIYLVDPANIFHSYSGSPPLPITIPADNCLKLDTTDFGLAGFNQVGNWVLVADAQDGFPFLYEFTVTFMVIPESIIGALAVVLPSIGAFAGYKVLRGKSK
jgi:hypothetical protein